MATLHSHQHHILVGENHHPRPSRPKRWDPLPLLRGSGSRGRSRLGDHISIHAVAEHSHHVFFVGRHLPRRSSRGTRIPLYPVQSQSLHFLRAFQQNRKIEQHYITFTFIGSQFDDYDLKITFNSSEELQEFLNDFYKIVPVVEIGGVENE